MVSKKYFIILNPNAAGGRAGREWPKMEQELKRAGFDYQTATTQYPGQAITFAQQFASSIPDEEFHNQILLVIGGDGTLQEVLNGAKLANRTYQIPIAYLPFGSGNDFARATEIPRNWQKALLEMTTVQVQKTLNIGIYQDNTTNKIRYFVNSLGVGFDANIVNLANKSKIKPQLNRIKLGALSYPFFMPKVFFQQKGFPVQIEYDGTQKNYNNVFLTTMSNHQFFGGGVKILPAAAVNEPNLDLIVVEKMNFISMLFMFLMLKIGGRHLKFKKVHAFKFKNSANLRIGSIEMVQIDGEIIEPRSLNATFSTTTYPFWIR